MVQWLSHSSAVISDIMPKSMTDEDLTVKVAVSSSMDDPSVNRVSWVSLSFWALEWFSKRWFNHFLSFLFGAASSDSWHWRAAHPFNNCPGECPLLFSSLSLTICNTVLSLQVKLKANSVIQTSKLTVSIQPPLAVTQDQFILEPMGQSLHLLFITLL